MKKGLVPGIGLLFLAGAMSGIPALAQSEPKVSIHCRVAGDIGLEPVVHARLTLSGGKLSGPVVAYTSESGVCALPDVPPGRYLLTIDKAGYFPRSREEEMGGGPISIDAQVPTAELGDIGLSRVRAISGTVRWLNGDPAERVAVHAQLVRRGTAAFRPGEGSLVGTNDRGEFRLERLRPGRYVVCAYSVGVAGPDAKPLVTLPVFYPDSDHPDVSGSVDLRQTAEVSGILINLRETSGVRVQGKIALSQSVPEGAAVTAGLMPRSPGAEQPFTRSASRVGQFVQFSDVPPGSYTLVAYADRPYTARTFQSVEVGTQPIDDLTVRLDGPSPITGKIEIEQAADQGSGAANAKRPPVPVAKVRVLAQCPILGLFGVITGNTDDDGQFHLDNPANGETYALTVQAPADTYVARVTQGDRELPYGPFPVSASGDLVRVLLKRDGGKINGTVQKREGVSAPALIVLAPKDHKAQQFFRSTTAAGDGTFALSPIAPGEYDLFAFDRNEEDAYLDDAYLRAFKTKAVAVTVQPNANLAFSLEVLDASKGLSAQ